MTAPWATPSLRFYTAVSLRSLCADALFLRFINDGFCVCPKKDQLELKASLMAAFPAHLAFSFEARGTTLTRGGGI